MLSIFFSSAVSLRKTASASASSSAVFCLCLCLFAVAAAATAAAVNAKLEYNRYACVVDAGSTGSRIHVYRYVDANAQNPLISVDVDEDYHKFKPGLSSFEQYPSDAPKIAEYWEPILEYARAHVPLALRAQTMFFVLASAGMRKVRQRDARIAALVMHNTHQYLSTHSDFKIYKNGVKIIEGTDEGVWGWMAANYLNGQLSNLLHSGDNDDDPSATPSKTIATKGILEMGGESVQLTFMPRANTQISDFNAAYIKSFTIGSQTLRIFSYSWMGIGMQAMQSSFRSYLEARKADDAGNKDKGKDEQSVVNPCTNGDDRRGNFDNCYALLSEAILKSKSKCNQKLLKLFKEGSLAGDTHGGGDSEGEGEGDDRHRYENMLCTPNNILIPNIFKSNPNHFYLIENFYYLSRDLHFDAQNDMVGVNGKYRKALQSHGKAFCALTRQEIKADDKYQDMGDEEIEKTCFSAVYLLLTIDDSFDFKGFENYAIVRDIGGVGIDWVLGYLVMAIPQIENKSFFVSASANANTNSNGELDNRDGARNHNTNKNDKSYIGFSVFSDSTFMDSRRLFKIYEKDA